MLGEHRAGAARRSQCVWGGRWITEEQLEETEKDQGIEREPCEPKEEFKEQFRCCAKHESQNSWRKETLIGSWNGSK